jgi:hypothetical protein
MAATIVREHRISIDGAEWVVFSEVRNGAPAERWRLAAVLGNDWRVCPTSHVSRKEAFDKLYLVALPPQSAAP